MKKLLVIYLMLLVGMVHGQDMFQKELFSADRVMKNREELKLTDAQATKIKKIHAENAGEFSTLKWDLDEETKKLNAMLEDNKPNQAAVQAQMDKVLALESTLKKKKLSALVAIKNELTDEQIETLKNSSKTVAGSYFFRNNNQTAKVIQGQASGTGYTTIGEALFPDSDNNKVMIRVNGSSSGNQPLFVIKSDSGTEMGTEMKDFDLDPNDIESISVLKDKSATEVYGVEGKDGVIIITVKKGKVVKKKKK